MWNIRLSDKEIEERANITLKTANVTGQSTDEVSEQLTAVWNGYKVNAEEAELYVDKLAAVAATTASNLQELSTGMSKVASAANTMGVNEEQLASILSTVISTTREAPETIGTSFKTIFSRISDIKAGLDDEVSLGNYSGKMAELGINVLDANNHLRDMGQVIQEIGTKWQSMSREQQLSLAQVMAGKQQYSRLIALFDNFDQYNKSLGVAQNAMGTLEEQQQTYMDQTVAHLNTLRAATENVYNSLGNTEAVNSVIDLLTDLTNGVATFVDGLGGGAGVLQTLGALGVSVFSSQIAKSINTTISNAQKMRKEFSQTKAKLKEIQEWKGNPNLEKVSKELLEYQQRILSLSKNMDPKEQQEYNAALQNFINLYNKFASVAGKKDELSGAKSEAEKLLGVAHSQLEDNNPLKKSIQDLQKRTFKSEEEELNTIRGLLEQVQETQKIAIDDIDEVIKEFEKLQDAADEAKKAEEAATGAKENLNGLNEDKGLQLQIEGVTKLASGFVTTTTAVNQLGEAIDIYNNKDLTSQEKFSQIISNITASAPMAVMGIKNLAEGISSIALVSKTASLGITGIFTAASIALGVVVKLQQQEEEARKERLADYQKEIQEEKEKQQQLASRADLYEKLAAANQKYKNNQINRTELKTEVQELVDQYGLESQAVARLTSNYDNLTAAIIKNKGEDIDARNKSLEREKKSASQALQEAADEFGNKHDDDISFSIAGGYFSGTTPVYEVLKKTIGGQRNADLNYLTTTFENNEENLVDYYTKLDQAIIKAQELAEKGTITQQQLSEDKFYKNAKEIRDSLKAQVEEYKIVLDETEKATVESAVNTAEQENKVNFEHIESLKEYQNQRQNLRKEIQHGLEKSGKDFTQEQLDNETEEYLKNNFSKVYLQFDELDKYTQQIGKRAGQIDEQTDKALTGLDEAHLDYLMELGPDVINDWNQLREVIQRISKIDLSNTENVDISTQIDEASEKYQKYQSLEEQVRGGKTVSKSEYKELDPQIQAFFSQMANGSYKMTEDAKTFYDVVGAFKLDGFYSALKAINDEIKVTNNLVNQEFNYDELSKSAYSLDAEEGRIDQGLVQKQLDYLEAVTVGDEKTAEFVKQWKEALATHELDKDAIEAINNKIAQVKDQTGDLENKLKTLNQQSTEILYQLHDALFPTDEDVDSGALESLSQTLAEVAGQMEGVSTTLKDHARSAEDVAESILRYDDGIQDIAQHYDDWLAALNSGSLQDQAEVFKDLRDAYADFLDVSNDSFSTNFLKNAENLQLMNAAIDGDIEAYNRLEEAAAKDIRVKIGIDDQTFQSQKDRIYQEISAFAQQDFDSLEVGFEFSDVDNTKVLQALEEIINQTEMTAEQASDYLVSSLGIDAEVVQAEPQTTTYTLMGSTVNFQPVDKDGYPQDYHGYNVTHEPNPQQVEVSNPSPGSALKVLSAHKTAGGDLKYKQAKNGAGSGGQARRKKKEEDTKKNTSSLSKKDTKKPVEDQRDLYHDVNIELGDIERNLTRVQKKQDRLYGKQLLDNLNEQSAILEQHKNKLREKQSLQQADLAQQQQILAGLGVVFDQYGNIANYMDVLAQKQLAINALVQQYNALISKFNAAGTKEEQDAIGEQIDEINKRIQNAEDDLKNTKDKISYYDSLREAIEDINDKIEDETQKQIEINIKKFRMELEIRLDMGQAERDWNNFRRNVIQHTDIIKDSDFSKVFKDAKKDYTDIMSYFNVNGSKGSIQKLTEQLYGTQAQIQSINRTGTSSIYGDNKAQAMEDLQNDLSTLMGQLEDIQTLIDNIDEAYLATIDDISSQMDKQIDDYEYIAELINHDMDLLTLIYGEQNYAAMDRYYRTLNQNQLNEIDSLRKQSDYWKKLWDQALAEGETQSAKRFEQNYRKTISNLNKVIEDSAKTLQDKYINSINSIWNALNQKVTGGKGLDYVELQWQLIKKNTEDYLDTINSAFAIQNIESKYNQALEKARNSSLKSQKALRDARDEQLEYLRSIDKLTEYDVQKAEKKLQLKQAEIALEEAQANKTTMQLSRDTQGNYSYQYVASETDTYAAEQQIQSIKNDLYNIDVDKYKENLEDLLNAYKEYQEQANRIKTDADLNDRQKEEALALLKVQYGEYINRKTNQNLRIRGNLQDSAFAEIAALYDTDLANYENMSQEEQDELMTQLVPTWNSGVQQMADTFAGNGGFIPVCEDAFRDLERATIEYENDLDTLATVAGIDLDNVRYGTDALTNAFWNLIEPNDALIGRMETEMDSIRRLRDEAQALVDKYRDVYNAAMQAVSANHQFLQSQREVAAAAASGYSSGGIGSGSSGSSGYSGSSSGYSAPATSSASRKASSTSSSSNYNYNWTEIEGVAGYIESIGGINDPIRKASLVSTYGNDEAWAIQNYLNDYYRKGKPKGFWSHDITDYSYWRRFAFETGGYTGEWTDDSGRLAVLHQKEIVLNQQDTKNLLDSVKVLRSIANAAEGNAITKMSRMYNSKPNSIINNDNTNLEQSVHIEASFPNVNSKKEIEEAFSDLVQLAAQRAMRY